MGNQLSEAVRARADGSPIPASGVGHTGLPRAAGEEYHEAQSRPSGIQAVVAGLVCLDIIPDLSGIALKPDGFFVPGKLVEIGGAAVSTGGAVANTGLALIKLGISTALVGKVGDDPFGMMVRSLLARWGAADWLKIVPGEATSYTVVLSLQGLDRMLLHDTGASARFGADDIPLDVLRSARLFHLGYPPSIRRLYVNNGEELLHILRLVKGMGLTTSLDMALPDPDAPSGRADWVAILSRVLPYVDIFLPSAEEILYMLDRSRYESCHKASPDDIVTILRGDDLTVLGDRLLDMGTAIVGIKCGGRGLYLRTANLARLQEVGRARPSELHGWPNRELWHPAFSVPNYAGTTGAGDSAIAGFLAGFLRGYTSNSCLEYACAVGAFNVTAPDALSGLRSWSETVAAVAAGWQKTPLDVAGAGWVPETNGVWTGPRDTRCAKRTRSQYI